MDNITFVTTSLKYFDENSEKYEGVLKHAIYIKYIPAENDMSYNIIVYYDKNKKEIFRSRYEIIGLYNSDVNTWTWSWAIPTFKKNNTGTARKLLNYGLMLDPSIKYLKTELITSRFRVADLVQLDIHVAIASYISKNPFVYKYGMARYNVSPDGNREISDIRNSIDDDGFIIINQNIDDTLFIYYIFLLDHEKINISNSKNNIANSTESVESVESVESIESNNI